jgi:predicted RNase H-like HicB family nuclease
MNNEYVIVIEPAGDGSFSAYVPDLPGCVSCGDTLEELRIDIKEAITLHIESLKAHNEPVPPPSVQTERIAAA